MCPHLTTGKLECCVGRVGVALMYLRHQTAVSFAGTISDIDSSSVSRIVEEVCLRIVTHANTLEWVGNEEVKKHTPRAFSETWPHAVMIVDMTYLYLMHSSDPTLAAVLRSFYKKREHAKAIVCTLPDGRPLTVGRGLYGSDSDGKDDQCLYDTFKNCGLGEWIVNLHAERVAAGEMGSEEKLIIIADRGYVDQCSVPADIRHLVKIITPEWPDEGTACLTEEQANESRKITRHRNVVECANRRLKEYHIISNRNNNILLAPVINTVGGHRSKLHLFLKVVAIVQFRWRKPLRS